MLTLSSMNPWRRVKALRPYSDAHAQMIYEETIRRHASQLAATSIFGLFVAFVVAGVTIGLSGFFSTIVYSAVGSEQPGISWIFVVIPAVLGPLAGAISYSGFRLECVEDCIEGELKPRKANILRCERCGYSLVGLPIVDDRLCCPECAHKTSMDVHNILDDLGIRHGHRTSTKP